MPTKNIFIFESTSEEKYRKIPGNSREMLWGISLYCAWNGVNQRIRIKKVSSWVLTSYLWANKIVNSFSTYWIQGRTQKDNF